MILKIIGFLSIALGVIMIVYNGFGFATTEKVANIGTIQIRKENDHLFQWSPLLGIFIFSAGVAIVVIAVKTSDKFHEK